MRPAENNVQMVKLLVELGADPRARDLIYNGTAPHEMLRLLVDHGIDLDAPRARRVLKLNV